MTAAPHPSFRPRSGVVATTVAVAALSASGPMAMWIAGQEVSVGAVAVTSTVWAIVGASELGRRVGVRVLAVLVLGVAVAATVGPVAGWWFAMSAVASDLIVRRRPPLRRLRSLPAGSAVPAIAVMSSTLVLPNDRVGSLPYVLAIAALIVLLAGAAMPRRAKALILAGASIGVGGIAWAMTGQVATGSALLSTVVLGALCATAMAARSHPWGLRAREEPLAFAAPAMAWAMAVASIWAGGVVRTGGFGSDAWRSDASLDPWVDVILGLTGVPLVGLGALAIGATLTLGRHRLDTIAGRGGLALLIAAGVGVAGAAHPPF